MSDYDANKCTNDIHNVSRQITTGIVISWCFIEFYVPSVAGFTEITQKYKSAVFVSDYDGNQCINDIHNILHQITTGIVGW